VPQLFLHIIGFPALGLYFLFRNRAKLHHPVVRARFGLFLGGYRSDRYYWEVVVIFRKVAVVILSIFGTAMRIEIQALCALLLILICLVLQVAGQPYKVNPDADAHDASTDHNPVLVWLELTALLVLWITLWGGVLMFQLDDGDPSDIVAKQFITVFICVINGILIIWMVWKYVFELFNENSDNAAVQFLNKKVARISKLTRRSSAQKMLSRPSFENVLNDIDYDGPNKKKIVEKKKKKVLNKMSDNENLSSGNIEMSDLGGRGGAQKVVDVGISKNPDSWQKPSNPLYSKRPSSGGTKIRRLNELSVNEIVLHESSESDSGGAGGGGGGESKNNSGGDTRKRRSLFAKIRRKSGAGRKRNGSTSGQEEEHQEKNLEKLEQNLEQNPEQRSRSTDAAPPATNAIQPAVHSLDRLTRRSLVSNLRRKSLEEDRSQTKSSNKQRRMTPLEKKRLDESSLSISLILDQWPPRTSEVLAYLTSSSYVHMPLSSYVSGRAQDAMRCMFRLLDTDDSGTISVVELTSTLKKIGRKLGKNFYHPSPMALFAKIDTDRSGDLDINEFVRGVCGDKETRMVDDDVIFVRIALALDHLSGGGLGGIYGALSERVADTGSVVVMKSRKSFTMSKMTKKISM